MELNASTQLYIYGRLFRILMDAAREKGANQAELENATHNPLAGLGLAHNLVIKLHKMTPSLEKKVRVLIDQLDVETGASLAYPSLEMQSNFMAGYLIGGKGLFEKSNMAVLRVEAGLTQSDLASKIGVHQKDVSRWENGVVRPSASNLKLIAEALNCKIEDLFWG